MMYTVSNRNFASSFLSTAWTATKIIVPPLMGTVIAFWQANLLPSPVNAYVTKVTGFTPQPQSAYGLGKVEPLVTTLTILIGITITVSRIFGWFAKVEKEPLPR